MRFQIGARGKGLFAKRAFEWLLPGMRPHVRLQIGFLHKLLGAMRTFILPLSFMDLHVSAQILLPFRLELAVRTFEREVLIRILERLRRRRRVR